MKFIKSILLSENLLYFFIAFGIFFFITIFLALMVTSSYFTNKELYCFFNTGVDFESRISIFKTFYPPLAILLSAIIAGLGITQNINNSKQNELEKKKRDLFEQQMKIYEEISAFFKIVKKINPRIDYSDTIQFYRNTVKAKFLFKKEVYDYIENIRKNAIELISVNEEYKKFFEDKVLSKEDEIKEQSLTDKMIEVHKKLTTDEEKLDKLFKVYIDLYSNI